MVRLRDQVLADITVIRGVLVEAMERAGIPAVGAQLAAFPIAFRHGLETCDAMSVLITAERDAHATMAARSFHEIAIECLWASRETDGALPLLKSAFTDERAQWNDLLKEAASLAPDDAAHALGVVSQLDDLALSAGIPVGLKNTPTLGIAQKVFVNTTAR